MRTYGASRNGVLGILTALLAVVSASGVEVATTVRVTHGPILGRPGTDSMSLWVRTDRPGEVRVYYGTDKEQLTAQSAPVRTRRENDNGMSSDFAEAIEAGATMVRIGSRLFEGVM